MAGTETGAGTEGGVGVGVEGIGFGTGMNLNVIRICSGKNNSLAAHKFHRHYMYYIRGSWQNKRNAANGDDDDDDDEEE